MFLTILNNIMDATSLKVYTANVLTIAFGSVSGTIGAIMGIAVSIASLIYTILRCMNEWKKYKSNK